MLQPNAASKSAVTSSHSPVKGNPLPLRWWSGQQRSELAAALNRGLAKWAGEWGIPQSACGEVRCQLASELTLADASPSWTPWPAFEQPGTETQRWWRLVPNSPRITAAARLRNLTADPLWLVTELFRPFKPDLSSAAVVVSPLSKEVAASAWFNLWRQMGEALRLMEAAPPPWQAPVAPAARANQARFGLWSGTVMLTWSIGDHDLHVLLSGTVVSPFFANSRGGSIPESSPRQPLVPLWTAASGLECALRVELQTLDLCIGAVQALCVGDMLTLPHTLDQPMLVKTALGNLIGEGFLGRVGDCRAVELQNLVRLMPNHLSP